jgi:hypothetical protein
MRKSMQRREKLKWYTAIVGSNGELLRQYHSAVAVDSKWSEVRHAIKVILAFHIQGDDDALDFNTGRGWLS